jgi:hypothetical protein
MAARASPTLWGCTPSAMRAKSCQTNTARAASSRRSSHAASSETPGSSTLRSYPAHTQRATTLAVPLRSRQRAKRAPAAAESESQPPPPRSGGGVAAAPPQLQSDVGLGAGTRPALAEEGRPPGRRRPARAPRRGARFCGCAHVQAHMQGGGARGRMSTRLRGARHSPGGACLRGKVAQAQKEGGGTQRSAP